MRALRPAAQDHRVARLQAQRARIGGHIRAALVDDAHHTERHRDTRDAQTVGPRPLGEHATDGILERGDVFEAARHRLEARIVELQTVEHRSLETFGPGRSHVCGIGLEQRRTATAQRIRSGAQGSILLRPRRPREDGLRRERRLTETAHQRLDIGGPGRYRRAGHCSTRSSRWMSSSRPV